ncbi:MAG: hypothetical protein PVG24_12955 [Gammaproteobacteria bacterium]|jgi:hypothetical protein
MPTFAAQPKRRMSAESLPLPRFLAARPALTAVVLTVAFAAIGYFLRYSWVEPEAIGNMCKSAEAVWWCPARTALIVTTEWNGLGYAAILLAVLSVFAGPRGAVALAFVAMAVGGAGLVLYNATEAGPGLILALLRLAWLERRGA